MHVCVFVPAHAFIHKQKVVVNANCEVIENSTIYPTYLHVCVGVCVHMRSHADKCYCSCMQTCEVIENSTIYPTYMHVCVGVCTCIHTLTKSCSSCRLLGGSIENSTIYPTHMHVCVCEHAITH
jgi:hypothetical protein